MKRTPFQELQLAMAALAVFAISFGPAADLSYGFHFPWDQGHDTCIPSNSPVPPDDCDKCNSTGSPFVVGTGDYRLVNQDLFIPGRMPEIEIDLTRVYHGRDSHNGMFGLGWTFTYGIKVIEVTDGTNQSAILRRDNGQRDRFVRESDGGFNSPPDVIEFLGRDESGFTLMSPDGITHRFDSSGNLASILDQNGNHLNVNYDDTGFITSVVDDGGRSLHFVKGPNGKVSELIDPAGRMFRYEYSDLGNLISITNPLGEKTHYTYDQFNRLTSVIDPEGVIVATATYDTLGRVVAYSEENRNFVLTHLDSQSAVVERSQTGKTRRLAYNNNINVTQITNALGISENIDYNSSFLPNRIMDEEGNSTSVDYDPFGNITTVTNALGGETKYTYEPTHNQLASITDTRGNATHFKYNNSGDLVEEMDPFGNITHNEYDSKGQLISVTNSLGHITRFAYDEHGNETLITDPLGNAASVEYDILGNTTTGIDAEGNRNSFEYDALNRVTAEIDARGNRAQYEYNTNGSITAYVDRNGNRFEFLYDSFDRLAKEVDPLERETVFEYDIDGRVISRTDAKGQKITYIYDDLDRLIQKNSSDNTTRFSYDSVGRLLSVDDNDSSLRFTYDELGRMVNAETTGTGAEPATTIKYSYDAAGNRVQMIDPNEGVFTYQYDALNRLTAITNPFGEISRYSYDGLSQILRRETADGGATSYTWDADGGLTAIKTVVGTDTIQDETYVYDRVGNRIQKNSAEGVVRYVYDVLYRLTSVDYPNGAEVDDELYTYDNADNRLSSHLAAQYHYDQAGQLVEDETFRYSYDENGNLIRKENKETAEITTYQWDTEDQLIRVDLPNGTVATFQYDGLGRRIAKSVDGHTTRFIYDGQSVLLEYDSEGSVIAQYTYGDRVDEPLSIRRDGTSYFFHTDSIRTVFAMTDAAGNVVQSYQYDSFGKIVNRSGNLNNSIGFTGRQWDGETGLYYYRTRYYDPTLGRYISKSIHIKPDPFVSAPDPNDPRELVETEDSDFDIAVLDRLVGESIATPLRSPITYAYAFNNPITVADPSGENPGLWRAIAAALAFIAKYGKKAAKFCKKIRCRIELHPAHHRFGWPYNQKMKHVHAICYIKGKKGSDKRIQIPYAK